jgi:hypothetical protein
VTTRRRRWAALATAAVVVATGTGIARAYTAPGGVDIATASGYFSFCADRQRDIAGITATDLTTANYGIDNYDGNEPGPLVGQTLPGGLGFVLGKSGIDGVNRRVATTQWVEWDSANLATRKAVQVRCKLRTRESLVRPESEKQRFDNGTASTTPWGFGPAAATGTGKTCKAVQEEIVAQVWADLPNQAAATYKYGTSSLVFDPEVVTNVGPNWILGTKVVSASAGVLHVGSSAVVNPSSDSAPGPDRFYGAHYCIFVAPEYIRSVMLGGPVL